MDVPVTSVISASDARAGGCPAREDLRVGGTVHADEVSVDERWRAEDSPHLAPAGVRVRAGATLTIEPCAMVRVGASRVIELLPGAALVARGEALRPIAFASIEAQPWGGIEAPAGVSAVTEFAHVAVVDAGARVDEERVPAALFVGASGLRAQAVSLRSSRGWGLRLGAGGAFAAGSTVDVEGASEGVAYVDDVDDVASIPLGRHARNAREEVLIAGHGRVLRRDARWGGVGLAYRVRDGVRLSVGGASAPQLRIAPGTTVRFGDDSALEVGVEGAGALWIDGDDAGAAVRMESASGGAARWFGLRIGAQIDLSRSAIRGLVLEGAGAPTGELVGGCGCAEGVRGDAAMLSVEGADPSTIVSNVLLRRGFARGVGVARRGAMDAPGRALVVPGRVDVTGAGVACAELGPSRGVGCAEERVGAQGNSRGEGVRSPCGGAPCTGASRGSRVRR